MTERQEWCADKLSKLQVEDLRLPTLTEIKDHFASITQDEATETAKVLPLPLVFDCLNDSNLEQVDTACEVLTLCMSCLSVGESTTRYSTAMERALNHPHVPVRLMTLTEIQRDTVDEGQLIGLSRQIPLLNAIIRRVGDADVGVAKIASGIVVEVGSLEEGIKQLLKADVYKTVYESMNVGEVERLRFYEIFINISKSSKDSFQALRSGGCLKPIFQDLANTDVLLKMNVIALLSQLIVTTHGYDYLESEGIIDNVLRKLVDDVDILGAQLCAPGIIKFFGHMAHWRPTEVFLKHGSVVQRIFSNIESDDLTNLGVSVDTVAHIAETNEGKLALESADGFERIFKVLVARMASLPTELRTRALSCLESLLRAVDGDNRVTNLVRKWFGLIGDRPMDWVLQYAQNPFFEIRLAGLGVISALTSHYWGHEFIRNTPGLVEFLMDRQCETGKDCKLAKYDIVKALSTSSVFDHGTQLRIQSFVREGPFYMEAVTEVAIEGD